MQLTYCGGSQVRIGDVFSAPRWGTCRVDSFDAGNESANVSNLLTGERFSLLGQPTFGESSLVCRRVRLDGRYTVNREFAGFGKPRHVVRFCGEFLGSCQTKRRALMLAENHRREWCEKAGIAA